MKLCSKCQARPAGTLGHDDLELIHPPRHMEPRERFRLVCKSCGANWNRIFTPKGPEWIPAATPS